MDITTDEAVLRLTVFVSVLLGMSVLEAIFPRKKRTSPRAARWTTNLGFAAVNAVALRLLVPLAAVGTAIWAETQGFGLLEMTAFSTMIEFIIALLFLDVALYWQHVATHRVPVFWRFHKVHHADRDLDSTSGVRFHPVEICLSMIYKMAIVALLGAPVVAVVVFEIILNACSIFNHANVRLPLWLDRILRIFIVTPDFHRVHHSVIKTETNSNYGFSLTLWDYLFGSYTAQPVSGHDDITIGLSEHQSSEPQKLGWSLILPFKS